MAETPINLSPFLTGATAPTQASTAPTALPQASTQQPQPAPTQASTAPTALPQSTGISKDDPVYKAMVEHVRRERSAARLAAINQMGAVRHPGLKPEHILAMAPDVDPRDPQGRETLAAWHKANSTLFHQGPAPDPRALQALEDVRHVQANIWHRGGAMFDGERLVESLFGEKLVSDETKKERARAENQALLAKMPEMWRAGLAKMLEDDK